VASSHFDAEGKATGAVTGIGDATGAGDKVQRTSLLILLSSPQKPLESSWIFLDVSFKRKLK